MSKTPTADNDAPPKPLSTKRANTPNECSDRAQRKGLWEITREVQPGSLSSLRTPA